MITSRRRFLTTTALSSIGLAIFQSCGKTINPTILVVSGWQDVNIGDIAHTPGLLHIIETFIPKAEIILWKKSKSEIVEELLGRSFPKVKIIRGDVDEQFNVNSEEVLLPTTN